MRLLRMVELGVGSAFLLGMFGVICANVVARYFFAAPLVWAEEVSNFLFVWSAYLGAAYVLAEDGHLRVSVVADRLPPRVQAWLRCASLALIAVIAGTLLWPTLTLLPQLNLTAAMRIPEAVPYAILPITMMLLVLHAVALMARMLKRAPDASRA